MEIQGTVSRLYTRQMQVPPDNGNLFKAEYPFELPIISLERAPFNRARLADTSMPD